MTRFGTALGGALLLAAVAMPALAQEPGSVMGRVTAEGRGLAAARVELLGTSVATLSGADGGYLLTGVAPGRYRIRATALGYAAREREVTLSGGTATADLDLSVRALAMDAVVVTGTMKQSTVAESTVKVDVVPAAVLQRVATNNLMESVSYLNGLYQQVDCGVCYTNNIRINGMKGPYTAVLIDGMPIMSSLASVYGLNGINPAIIERIEILKGPSSTLYGTEAMGGVVNVITRSPRFAPRLNGEAHLSSHGEKDLHLSAARTGKGMSGLLSGNVSRLDAFHDENGDGFSDEPLFTRVALFGKVNVGTEARTLLSVTGKIYGEDRFGGVEGWTERDRGSGTVYGESVRTRRGEMIGTLRPGWLGDRLRADFSLTHHEQDSFYGATRYDARQTIAYGHLLWDQRIAGAHDLLVGASVRHQLYDDDTAATTEREVRTIPGIFVQDDWSVTPRLKLLGGIRFDRHEEHGVISAPRASAKWQPREHTAFRVNAGTGFRVVNLFTEDHAALTGAREVVIAERLRPERSFSVAANVNQIIEMGPSPMMIDLDAFVTRFSNKIVPNYDRDPNQIFYENLRGYSVSRGLSLSLNQNVDFERILYTVGATVQDVFVVTDGARRKELFAPEFTGTWGVTYNHPSPGLSLSYSGRLTGPLRLPEYPEPFSRPTESATYTVHDAQVTWKLPRDAQIYLAATNLFDFRQGSPLIDPAHPFGDAFDTTYVWGPIKGREVLIGARFGVAR